MEVERSNLLRKPAAEYQVDYGLSANAPLVDAVWEDCVLIEVVQYG